MAGKPLQAGSDIIFNPSKEVGKIAKTIIVFIIAIIFLVIAFVIKIAHQKERAQIENCMQTYATIDRKIYSDTGEVKYYVSFVDNGRTIMAQTDYYSSETKSLDLKDEVKIGYFFIRENTAHAVILDDRVVPVSNSDSTIYKFIALIGILLLLVAVAMFAKTMFF